MEAPNTLLGYIIYYFKEYHLTNMMVGARAT